MIIAWVLFASTGIVLARFYKESFSRVRPCGFEFWFAIHRPVMLVALTMTIVAFIVILAGLILYFFVIFSIVLNLILLQEMDWKWVHSSERLEFVHSIAGIIAIILACVQVKVFFFYFTY
jgi:uncharacterized protein involved in cysteine biosynthesis